MNEKEREDLILFNAHFLSLPMNIETTVTRVQIQLPSRRWLICSTPSIESSVDMRLFIDKETKQGNE